MSAPTIPGTIQATEAALAKAQLLNRQVQLDRVTAMVLLECARELQLRELAPLEIAPGPGLVANADQYRATAVTVHAWHIADRLVARRTPGFCMGGTSCPTGMPDNAWPHTHTSWHPGDWLVRSVAGYHLVRPDLFELMYEPDPASERSTEPTTDGVHA